MSAGKFHAGEKVGLILSAMESHKRGAVTMMTMTMVMVVMEGGA